MSSIASASTVAAADVSDDVTYAVTGSCSPLVSDLEVAGGPGGHAQMLTACRANPFLTVLPVNGDVISVNRTAAKYRIPLLTSSPLSAIIHHFRRLALA